MTCVNKEMNMKRYLTLIAVLTVCLLFALVGCGSEGSSDDIPAPINSVSATAVKDKPLEAAISGLKLSAAANTFSQGSTITLIEQSPTGTGSNGYSASSRSYVINAYKDTDKGKSNIKELEQPVLLTILKKIAGGSEYYLGTRESGTAEWSYSYISPENSVNNPLELAPARASVASDYNNKSEFYVNIYKMNIEVAIFASFSPYEKTTPKITGLDNKVTVSDSIEYKNGKFTENLPFRIILSGENISNAGINDFNVKITYQNNSAKAPEIKAVGATAVNDSTEIPNEGSGNKYLHTITISQINNVSVMGNKVTLSFSLYTTGISTSDFTGSFNIEALSDSKSTLFKDSKFTYQTDVKLKLVEQQSKKDEPYIHAQMSLPENGSTGVASTTDIVINFEKDLQWDSGKSPSLFSVLAGSTRFECETVYSNKTVTLKHKKPFSPATTYAVKIADGLVTTDIPAKEIASDTFVFTTEYESDVTYFHARMTAPKAATGVASNSVITLSVDKDLKWDSASQQMITVDAGNEGIQCNISYKNKLITITHEEPFKYDTEYRVKVAGNISATESGFMLSPDTFTFTTEKQPDVTYIHATMNPADGTVEVASDSVITLTYDKELLWNEESASMISIVANDETIVTKAAYNNKTITLTHDAPFKYGITYTVSIAGNIATTDKFFAVAKEDLTFTAEVEPEAKFIYAEMTPASGSTDVKVGETIKLAVSDDLIWNAALSRKLITITTGDIGFDCDASYKDRVITITHNKPFNYSTDYSVNINEPILTAEPFKYLATDTIPFTTEGLEVTPEIKPVGISAQLASDVGRLPLQPVFNIDFGVPLTSDDWANINSKIKLNGEAVNQYYIEFANQIATITFKTGCIASSAYTLTFEEGYVTENNTNIKESSYDFITLDNFSNISRSDYWGPHACCDYFVKIEFGAHPGSKIGHNAVIRMLDEDNNVVSDATIERFDNYILINSDRFEELDKSYKVVIDEFEDPDTHQKLASAAYDFTVVMPTDAIPGKGTSDKPYLIYTADQLKAMNNNEKYRARGSYLKQVNDLDLNNEEWTPISFFYGNYDGNNKKISNMKKSGTSNNAGLFSEIRPGATVQNLTIENCDIEGYTSGGLAAYACEGDITINKVSVTGTIKGSYYVGGLIGCMNLEQYDIYYDMPPVRITNSWVKATIECYDSYVGGLIGYCYGYWGYYAPPAYIEINKCFSNSTITSTNNYSSAGGIIGYLEGPDLDMKYSYCKGVINNGSGAGGFIGYASCNYYRICPSIQQSYSAMTFSDETNVGSYFYSSYGSMNLTDCFTTCPEEYPACRDGWIDSQTSTFSLPDGYTAGKGWTGGPTTWEDSGVWETPIGSYPKLIGLDGQD